MSDTEKVRLLICHVCGTIDEIPWYEGNPKDDRLLEYRLANHKFPSGEPHTGDLAVVNQADWKVKHVRNQILQKLGEGRQAAGLGDDFYSLKDNFQADAMTCWKAHNHTTNCTDYHRESKRLVPDTRGDRKELGLSPKARPNIWLCDFCPVQGHIDSKKFG